MHAFWQTYLNFNVLMKVMAVPLKWSLQSCIGENIEFFWLWCTRLCSVVLPCYLLQFLWYATYKRKYFKCKDNRSCRSLCFGGFLKYISRKKNFVFLSMEQLIVQRFNQEQYQDDYRDFHQISTIHQETHFLLLPQNQKMTGKAHTIWAIFMTYIKWFIL